MKHIVNWFAGGFFRKLGNIFAYIILGVILSIILTKLDINLFNFIIVKADTTGTYTSASYEVRQCQIARDYESMNYYYTNCQSDTSNFNQSMSFGDNNGHITRYQWLLYNNTSNGWDVGSWDITLQMWKRPNVNSENLEYNYRFYANDKASSNGAISGNETKFISNYVCQQWTNNEDWFIRCKFYNKVPIKFFMIEMYLPNEQIAVSNTTGLYWWGIDNFTGSTDATGAINNQTTIIQNEFNETNQNINDIKDTLNDTDVDDDVSDTLDFFSDFDVGELSSLTQIVLSPFQFLGQLVVGNTNDICFTLKGTRACLPNGQKMLWNKTLNNCDSSFNFCPSSNGIELFKTFFNLVVGGFLSYKLLLKVFRTIHKALDPTENKVEVMNL